MLWIAGLAWLTRALVEADAEKAALRTNTAASAIFFLPNIVASPGWVGYPLRTVKNEGEQSSPSFSSLPQ
jgi:hypothetical protein